MSLPEIAAVLLALATGILLWQLFRMYREKNALQLRMMQGEKALSDLQLQVHQLADRRFEEFRTSVLQMERERIRAEQSVVAQAQLDQWKMEAETWIRQDAIKKSQAVTLGKVTEHMVPFFSGYFPYNPKEARFIGSPIDFLVFDGMETDPDHLSIHFIEVKTASSALTPKQRAIKYAVLNKRVEWRELRV